jgi:predicted HAD superfamily Cof-like phosphohydrolase
VVTPQEQVMEFHRAFGCATDQRWTTELGMLRADLIVEEFREVDEALAGHDAGRLAQELADLAYVTIGAALTLGVSIPADVASLPHNRKSLRAKCEELAISLSTGQLPEVVLQIPSIMRSLYYTAATADIDLNAAITAVHEANMSKRCPDGTVLYRHDGKVRKGPNYQPPDMSLALLGTR